jgi:hypothetical protein
VPLHPVVPNPYMLLAQILPGTIYYYILDLKDTFFCIPLHPKSPPVLAFEDPTWKSGHHLDCPPPRIQRQPPSLWVGSNPRLGRVSISTSYSATICRWTPALWIDWACHFMHHWILTKLPSR